MLNDWVHIGVIHLQLITHKQFLLFGEIQIDHKTYPLFHRPGDRPNVPCDQQRKIYFENIRYPGF